jgi:hypothetical protein
MRQSTKIHAITRGFRAFLPCGAAVVAQDPHLRGGDHPPHAGHAYVVIDGTLIPIDRVAADRPFYSGKHRRHGMNHSGELS